MKCEKLDYLHADSIEFFTVNTNFAEMEVLALKGLTTAKPQWGST